MNINEMANLYSLGIYSSYFLNAINGQDNTLYSPPSMMDIFTNYYSNPSDMMQAVTDVQNAANELSEASHKLSAYSENSIFDTSKVTTTSESATAVANGKVDKSKYTVNVTQLATNQINTGISLNEDDLDFQTGHNFFAIEKDGQKYTFDTYVYESSNNKTVLQNIADEINKKDIGLTATLNEDKSGNVFLSIASDGTGKNSSFNIYDVAGTVTESGGFSNTTQTAQNAIYTVDNGNKKESETNTLQVDDNLTVDVTDTGKFDINAVANSEGVSSSIEEFVGKLNDYLKTVYENSEFVSSSVQSSVESIKSVANTLSTIGINFNGSEFEITDKFYELVKDPERVESTIQPIMESVASEVKSSAATVSDSSMYELSGALNSTGSYLGYSGGSINSYVSTYLNELILSMMGSSFNAYG